VTGPDPVDGNTAASSANREDDRLPPDDLVAEPERARLDGSSITQDAVRSSFAASATDDWLAGLTALDPTGVDHDTAVRAVKAAKDELWGDT
jgi:hypothetical protein